MSEVFTNNAITTLNGAITSGASSLVVTSATGFPTTGDFRIIIKAEGANTDEICTVTAVSGTTFTISRATEATAGVQTASAHGNGAVVAHVLTAGALRALNIPTGFIGCSIYHSTTSSATTAPFDTEIFDTDGFHDTVTNNSRVTIPAGMGGKYLAIFSTSATSGTVIPRFKVNGTVIGPNAVGTAGSYSLPNIQRVLALNGGDYLEVDITGGGTHGDTTYPEQKANLQVVKLDSGKIGSGVGAKVYNSTTQSVGSGGVAATFDSEDFDTDGFHSTGASTSRMTIPTGMAGIYSVEAGGDWAGTQTTYFYFKVNGTTEAKGRVLSSAADSISTTSVLKLNAGDYVEFIIDAVSGTANFGHASADRARAWFSIMRLDSPGTGVLASGVAESQSAFSTSSTSYVDITNMTVTLTTGARRCLVTFAGSVSNNNAGSWTAIRLLIDGNDTGNSTNVGISTFSSANANDIGNAAISFLTDVLTAGSHTFKLQMRVSAGTGKLREETKYRFAVQEMPDSGALASTGIGGGGGGTLQQVRKTDGSLTLTASVTTHTEMSSGLRLTIAAQSGDVLAIRYSGIVGAGTGEASVDSATIVSGSIVNQCSGGTTYLSGGHGYMYGASAHDITGTLYYKVTSADISSGYVTVSPTFTNSGTAGTIYATTTYPLNYQVLNLGH